jgi:5-methylcytosine-specific restriction endonuclease McrA
VRRQSCRDPRGAARRSPIAGNRGNGSKWIRRAKRLRIYWRDGGCCQWCGATDAAALTLDHILPRCKGGSNNASNLITSCQRCNAARGHMTVAQFAARFGVAWPLVLRRVFAAAARALP